ncbi:MAG: DNA-directed RNA polymerase subunit delta [Erysipelotrichaceae bacterium]|nr:DNA-directed RNA polymerase subunit delta [Erysipelotrichaceae bacterium]MDD3808903.1 DNA-directed RNA polymerase subunit delta [Erysipelotrichaceae bacterium]
MENIKSMTDIAYDILIEASGALSFYKIFEEIQKLRDFTFDDIDEKRSLFYTNITLDGRFITVGENYWDLRERHLFEEVHIDMNDIYSDEEEEIEEEEEDESIDQENYDD